MASTAASAELIHVRAMEKEENRLNMKRAQNKARLQRFLDARTRTIGLDVGALNAQMEQRKKMKELEKEADRLEAQRNAEIVKILEAQEHADRLSKKQAIDSFKVQWEEQRKAIEERKLAEKTEAKFSTDPAKCGLASLQKMSGEDDLALERKKTQQKQMKNWIYEQLEEKKAMGMVSGEEDRNYCAFIKKVAELSQAEEENEKLMTKHAAREVQSFNNALAEQKAKNAQDAKKKKLEDDAKYYQNAIADPMLCELNDYTMPNGRINRLAFRGFTQAQRNQIFNENCDIIADKAKHAGDDKIRDILWAKQQQIWCAQAALAEEAERLANKSVNAELKNDLMFQAKLHREKLEKSKKDKFGEVSNEFYGNFGTSCR